MKRPHKHLTIGALAASIALFAGSAIVSGAGPGDDGTVLVPTVPIRVLDTRLDNSPVSTLGQDETATVSFADAVPVGTRAVDINVTTTLGSAPSFLAVYPSGMDRPTVSAVNWNGPTTQANAIAVKLSADYEIDIYNAFGTVDVVIDMMGYYVDAPSNGGPTGPAGPAGPTGATGTKGNAGDTGAIGPQGVPGFDGADGADGAAGPKGDTGAAGADGIDGTHGIDGLDGTDGIDGTHGIDGTNGTNGVDGAIGPIGPIGPAGPTGAVGPAGPTGPAGADGNDGIDGTNGVDGATGPQGPIGPVGPTGQTGPQGTTGASGAPGAIGPVGPAGPIGPQGPAGTSGLSDVQTVIDSHANSGQGWSKTVTCPAGKSVIGGGFSATSKIHVETSMPSGTDSWTASGARFANDNGNTNETLTVYAICATAGV